MLGADEKPDVAYSDIGGMDMQKQEMREAVELPLSHFDLYKQIGEAEPRLAVHCLFQESTRRAAS
jgi:26S proteasome regulatory subunit T3